MRLLWYIYIDWSRFYNELNNIQKLKQENI